ncbi:MAG: family 10 glycosylhydrolase [Bacteroidetes bacterium]|nr:family 10 glycosylhydrolase [Bacteroidota bacterium]
MRKSSLILTACFSIICLTDLLHAQGIAPKREFRGAWVATVANIDFPSVQGLSKERFMDEWVQTVDLLEAAGFNAVLAQVRPAGDAFYRSKISPWSKYLTGKQGVALDPEFDPLTFMVEEAHLRNLEFHAWLNPYRASMDTSTVTLAGTHPYKHHPEWFMRYGGKLYFNPALPEVRNYITEVVTEIVMDYDVDGIHFDDYFYPYPAAGELLPDSLDFAKFGFGFGNIEDWRRHNVDMMVGQVSQAVKLSAQGVKFGVSPFGVWRNVSKDPKLGSPTRAGINTYDDLYADVRGWLEKGWIDYVAPQLYWHIGFPVADYELLLKWWKDNSFGRNVYAGQAGYKIGNNAEPAWNGPNEIPKQIRLNRATPGIDGSIFYNLSSLRKNPFGVTDSLRNHYYSTPALLPELAYMNLPVPAAPVLGKPKLNKKGGLRFTCNVDKKTLADASTLVIYRFEDRLPGDYNNPNNILQIIRINGQSKIEVQDTTVQKGKIYTYAVSAMNPQHSESLLSNWRAVLVGNRRLKKVR